MELAVPAGKGKSVEVLGTGPSAAPAVVEMLRKVGLL